MPLRLLTLLLLLLLPRFLFSQDLSYVDNDFHVIKEANGLSLEIRRFACERSHLEARTILLVHGGGPGGDASFGFGVEGSFADSLAHKGFIVYIMNIRGWEGSTAPAYNIHDTSLVAGSCAEAAEDIDVAIEHIRKRENVARVSLFGWAAGGHWASYYTTLHNDKIDHLIVLNSLYGVKAPWDLSKAFADPDDSNRYNSRIPAYRESDSLAIITARLASIPFPDKTPWVDTAHLRYYEWSVANDSDRLVLRVPGGYRRESFNMAHGYQYWNAKDIRVPTLIVRSQYDSWSRPADVAAFYNDLSNAPRRETIELAGATHFVTIDNHLQGRDSLVAAIDRFVIPPAPSPLTIDSLRTDEQVETFVRRFDGVYSDLFIDSTAGKFRTLKNDRAWRRSYGAVAWAKGDFDNDGRTDLLFNGYSRGRPTCFVALTRGQDSFRLVTLTQGTFIYFFAAKKISIGGKDYVGVFRLRRSYGDNRTLNNLPKRFDTLTYRFEHFIERSIHPKAHSIHELRFSIWPAEPSYSLTVRGDSLWLNQDIFSPDASSYTTEHSLSRLSSSDAHKLYGLLQYIDIPGLRSHYSVSWTDASILQLQLKFDANKIKHIEDYGGIGTYGLAALYDLLDSFRENWRLTSLHR